MKLLFILTSYFQKKRSNLGFTLIELLVVVLIVGTLAGIALPTLIRQVSRARETEAKNNLGAINRAQHAYMYRHGVFATTIADMNLELTVGFYNGSDYVTEYYTYTVSGTPNSGSVFHDAIPQPSYSSDIRWVTSATFRDANSAFRSIICEADDVSITPVIVDENTCNDGEIIN